jgi:hypothetical protein
VNPVVGEASITVDTLIPQRIAKRGFIGKVILPVGNTETIINPVTKRDFSFIINRTCKGIEKLKRENKFLIDK